MDLNIKRNRIIFYSISIIGIIIIILVNINYCLQSSEIIKNYKITTGKISSINEMGPGGGIHMEYVYYVKSVKYKNSIYVPYEFEDCCRPESNECCSSVFWVIYSPDNPKNSMIDVTIDIQDEVNPTFPESLENFKYK